MTDKKNIKTRKKSPAHAISKIHETKKRYKRKNKKKEIKDLIKEDLLGKKIAVLVNLAPAKFRGEQSNGMLLAAEGEGVVSLLEPDKDIEDGSEVH